MSLREEMLRYEQITGESAEHVPIIKLGAFLDGYDMAIKVLEIQPRKGKWLRMSNLSEREDDRYKCSYCGNVVHHKSKMNLYTFNSWCGRCGSDNGRYIKYGVEI